jgi:hypothetical protein
VRVIDASGEDSDFAMKLFVPVEAPKATGAHSVPVGGRR